MDQRSMAEQLASAPAEVRSSYLAEITEAEAEALQWDWDFWGRPAQQPPKGKWSNWMILAGRGFGKTRTTMEWLRANTGGPTPLTGGKYGRIAIIAETAADARDVLVEGQSGILRITPKEFRPLYEPSKRRLTWPNGAVGTLYNATEPDQLRGPEHEAAVCDELAKWDYAQETWDMLQFGMRLGLDPQIVIATTPRPIKLLKEIIADEGTVVTRGNTFDNASNLAAKFIKNIRRKYEGTRLGRQELNAEILDDVPGALWTRKRIDALRRALKDVPPMQRVVVAVDPSGASGEKDDTEERGDDIGIIVAGKGIDGRGYVWADYSVNDGPLVWARRAVQAYRIHKADMIVAERNFGGAMVEAVIQAAAKPATVPVKLVTASRGKIVRAEPVAALYEKGIISHIRGEVSERAERESGTGLALLEDQLVQMTPSGYLGGGSPDRADALVWALTELFLDDDGYDLGAAL